jgi:hypothetical protein
MSEEEQEVGAEAILVPIKDRAYTERIEDVRADKGCFGHTEEPP